MMKPTIVLLALIALLSACAKEPQPQLIQKVYIVPDIPASLLKCPTLLKFPDYHNLTDIQVANSLLTLYRNNWTCKHNLNGVIAFEKKAKLDLQQVGPGVN